MNCEFNEYSTVSYVMQSRNSMSSDIWFLGGIISKTGKDQKGNSCNVRALRLKWGSYEAKAVENKLYSSAWPMTAL